MRIARSNRFFLNPSQKKALADIMVRDDDDGASVEEEMEEGEISDDPEVVDLTLDSDIEEDIDRKLVDSLITDSNSNSNSKPKVEYRVSETNQWMGDLLKFHVTSGYAPHIHNLAWARAVQNKPFDDIVFQGFGSDHNKPQPRRLMSTIVSVNHREENASSDHEKGVFCNGGVDQCSEDECLNGQRNSKVEEVEVLDKEEGELEEGEIELGLDLDLDIVEKSQELSKELKEISLEEQFNLILETLKTVTNDPKCFLDVCSRLWECLESLQSMGSKASDTLIQRCFTGIQTAYSVYCSENLKQQEQSKDAWLRLISHITKPELDLFSRKQVQDIEAMMESCDSDVGFAKIGAMDKEKTTFENNQIGNSTILSACTNVGNGSRDSGLLAEKSTFCVTPSDKISRPHSVNESVKPFSGPKQPVSGSGDDGTYEVSRVERSVDASVRGRFAPLIHLQWHQDADSLPSPTRENPPLSIRNLRAVVTGPATVSRHGESEYTTIYPSETDALKAVSSYQEKFGRTSFFSSNRLPSPTPSEECDNGDTDIGIEVSSSFVNKPGEFSSANLRGIDKPPSIGSLNSHGDFSLSIDGSSKGGAVIPSVTRQLVSGSNATVKPLPKSRDPRLRPGNPLMGAFDLNKQPPSVDTAMSRKQKIMEEAVLDGHRIKRQRNGLTDLGLPRDAHMISETGGWSEEGGVVPQHSDRDPQKKTMVKSDNGDVPNSNEISPSSEQLLQSGTNSAVSLPSLLKELAVNPSLLMNLLEIGKQRLAAESLQKSDPTGQITLPSSSVLPGPIPSGNVGSLKSSEFEQKTALPHQIPAQTASMNSQNDLGKVRMKPRDPRRILHNNIVQRSETLGVREQGEQAEATCSPLQSSSSPPDITTQFTKRLKNIADLVSNSQVITISPASNTDKENDWVLGTDTKDRGSNTISNLSIDDENKAGSVRLQDPWGDVDHLLDGYDDHQRATIQRERARRIEEQNKMFAARKLCLVLDLDHTLLNSAKFIEVDPLHEDILRRKEEQDREKPKRHLFRFAHMGMWTKLRPGIWNFLEKASKLYELHLYTMGNKLYATEMAKVLDPTGVLFNGRVISKGDEGDPFDSDERIPKSKDLDGVLGMESAVVIIDDSVRVWPHHRHNLIAVERYTYFPCSRRQFGLPGPSLLEIDHDERPEDGTLASSLAVIERIHQNFFSNGSLNSIDVRDILASEQRKILSGCRIIFSRVFPVGEVNPHLHPLWQTAQQFGAVCTNQLDDQVTHVVAISLGTDKVNWALSTGKFVVYPGWLEASALLYRRANEKDFSIVKP